MNLWEKQCYSWGNLGNFFDSLRKNEILGLETPTTWRPWRQGLSRYRASGLYHQRMTNEWQDLYIKSLDNSGQHFFYNTTSGRITNKMNIDNNVNESRNKNQNSNTSIQSEQLDRAVNNKMK